MPAKITELKKILKEKGLDGFIVTSPVNIFYLTGFKGVSPLEREAILVVTPKRTALITARLYQQESLKLQSRLLDVKIIDERSQIYKSIKDLLSQSKKVGFEEHDLRVSELKEFRKGLKRVRLVRTKNLVENLRIIKTEQEIINIEKAQKITQKAFDQIIKYVKPGKSEAEIAETLAKILKALGGQGLAFESIVASGPNSALPHYTTGNKKIKRKEVLLFDFGAKYKNYCADLSRTIFVGRALDEHRNIYNYVQSAQIKAIEKITHDLKASSIFHKANAHFKKYNLHENFIHSLGHGVGLEVHEKPSLSKKSADILKEGMIFSIEPGLYFPNWGGVRIEDLIVIKNGKAKILGNEAQFIQI